MTSASTPSVIEPEAGAACLQRPIMRHDHDQLSHHEASSSKPLTHAGRNARRIMPSSGTRAVGCRRRRVKAGELCTRMGVIEMTMRRTASLCQFSALRPWPPRFGQALASVWDKTSHRPQTAQTRASSNALCHAHSRPETTEHSHFRVHQSDKPKL